jgi:hypothetical protein
VAAKKERKKYRNTEIRYKIGNGIKREPSKTQWLLHVQLALKIIDF